MDDATTRAPEPRFTDSNRTVAVDKKFATGVEVTGSFENHFFQRLIAKKVSFQGVNFRYTIFDSSYLRECVFQDCNFTGCRFTSSNLYRSTFVNCTFDYAIFERTIVENDILDGGPSRENLKLRFARTLRTNYQALGEVDSVNKAIHVELAATAIHLWKGWFSSEKYYRAKYPGTARVRMFLAWLNFKFLDLVWGNGESALKLLRALFVILTVMVVVDVALTTRTEAAAVVWRGCDAPYTCAFSLAHRILHSLNHVPAVFVGAKSPPEYPELYSALIVFVRLVMMGFLLSIIIKRFSRR